MGLKMSIECDSWGRQILKHIDYVDRSKITYFLREEFEGERKCRISDYNFIFNTIPHSRIKISCKWDWKRGCNPPHNLGIYREVKIYSLNYDS